jgi:hypothetical protein
VLRRAVDVYSEDPGTELQDLVMSLRQADQLAVAIRSPVAAQEHEHCRRVQMIRERPGPACLIGDGEVGSLHRISLAGHRT